MNATSAVRTTTYKTKDIENPNGRGIHAVLNVKSITTGIFEIQNIVVDATGGTYTLSYGGNTTSAIAFNADPATVESALRGLASIGNPNVSVITGNPSGMDVTFLGPLGGVNVAQITADASGLTGGGQAVNITTKTQGAPGASVTFSAAGKDPASDNYYSLLSSNPINGPGVYVLKIYPGISTVNGPSTWAISDVLPSLFQLVVTHSNNFNVDYTIGFHILP